MFEVVQDRIPGEAAEDRGKAGWDLRPGWGPQYAIARGLRIISKEGAGVAVLPSFSSLSRSR